jgi:hypothetical protein
LEWSARRAHGPLRGAAGTHDEGRSSMISDRALLFHEALNALPESLRRDIWALLQLVAPAHLERKIN